MHLRHPPGLVRGARSAFHDQARLLRLPAGFSNELRNDVGRGPACGLGCNTDYDAVRGGPARCKPRNMLLMDFQVHCRAEPKHSGPFHRSAYDAPRNTIAAIGYANRVQGRLRSWRWGHS